MRFEEVSRMEQRSEMLKAPEKLGMTVAEVAELWGISRQTFYLWRRRLRAGEDLENRSPAPLHSPNRMAWEMESRIIEMRKAHHRWGARRIRAELVRKDLEPPARSTINQVLARNDLLGVR